LFPSVAAHFSTPSLKINPLTTEWFCLPLKKGLKYRMTFDRFYTIKRKTVEIPQKVITVGATARLLLGDLIGSD
jgi:hypothetical protein